MDLDDDELWATQYSNRYVKKSKIENKIKELEEELNRVYMEGKLTYNHEYATFLKGKINILYDLLEEK